MIWNVLSILFVFWPGRYSWEENIALEEIKALNPDTNVPNEVVKTVSPLKGQSLFAIGRNLLIFVFFFNFATNIYTLFWNLQFWAYNFALFLLLSVITIGIILKCPIKVNRWLEQWELLLVAIILFFLPAVTNLIFIFLLDCVYGILFGCVIHHFLANRVLIQQSQWKSWRSFPTIYASLFFMGILAFLLMYMGIGLIKEKYPSFEYQEFTFTILILAIISMKNFLAKNHPK
jgi:hypothetical protein